MSFNYLPDFLPQSNRAHQSLLNLKSKMIAWFTQAENALCYSVPSDPV